MVAVSPLLIYGVSIPDVSPAVMPPDPDRSSHCTVSPPGVLRMIVRGADAPDESILRAMGMETGPDAG